MDLVVSNIGLLFYKMNRGHRGRDRMVVGFMSTYVSIDCLH
jgi:hypothetical protein